MGFRGLLELLGITLEAPSAVISPVECDLELDVHSPDLLLEYDDEAWLIALGDSLPLDVHSPNLLLEYDDSELILVCPY